MRAVFFRKESEIEANEFCVERSLNFLLMSMKHLLSI